VDSKSDGRRILAARGLRAFGDGYVAVLLPVHLASLGYGAVAVGAISTATLLGSAVLTLALGATAHRLLRRSALLAASLMMAGTGLGFAFVESFWPLMVIAFVGTLNPTSGDVSVFLPLEHTVLSQSVPGPQRTAMFARYSFVGSVVGACGALAAGAVDWLAPWLSTRAITDLLFILYGALGLATLMVYRGLSPAAEAGERPVAPLGPSRRRVLGLSALFAVDSFGGGFVVNALLATWLFQRFQIEVSTTAAIFFVTGLCAAFSFFAAVPLANRFGLVNTMVFTHLPANLFLALAAFAPNVEIAFALLICRSLLSSMDVPARSAYVMSVVTPAERPAAASVTAVPRSLASALAPILSGWLLGMSSFGWPLVIAGVVKATYDVILLRQFAKVRPHDDEA
jgi:MFS family permease